MRTLRSIIALVALGRMAAAQAPPAPPGRDPEHRSASDDIPQAKTDARAEFDRGIQSFQHDAIEAALAAFQRSIALYPTRAAVTNAALCLRRLGRFEEALTMLESLPAQFGAFSEVERVGYDATVAELSKEVGWIELRGIEPGAQILVDGRERGTSPLASPLRVNKGLHRLRILKAGESPVEEELDVPAGERSVLRIKTASEQAPASIDSRPMIAPPSPPPPEPESDPRWLLGADVGGLLSSLGGDVVSCGSACNHPLAWGGRVRGRIAYRLDATWAISLEGGYLRLSQNISDRATSAIAPAGLQDQGQASDALSLSGELVGAAVEVRRTRPIDTSLRLGAGALLGGLRDERSGPFVVAASSTGAGATYNVGRSQRPTASYAYVSIVGELGYLPTPRLRLGVGLEVTGLMALHQPAWDDQDRFVVGGARQITFARETLSARFIPLFAPLVEVQYAF